MTKGKSVPGDKRPIPKEQAKKPYTKPTFRFERVFETQALTCGKTGTLGQCHSNRKNS
ncbi:MAG TPA: hypothetical protein VJX69_10505 [Terriglobales bacterium]|nr:hypothetical protein [Terriglobales bacterium]